MREVCTCLLRGTPKSQDCEEPVAAAGFLDECFDFLDGARVTAPHASTGLQARTPAGPAIVQPAGRPDSTRALVGRDALKVEAVHIARAPSAIRLRCPR